MHEPGPNLLAGQRAGVREQRVHERPAGRPVSGMRHHSGRLVDDQQIGIFVHDVEGDLFGSDDEWIARHDREVERIAFLERVARLDRLAVDAHVPQPDGLHQRACHAGQARDDHVGAFAGFVRTDDV